MRTYTSFFKNRGLLYYLFPSHVPWKPIGFGLGTTTYCNLNCTICSRAVKKIKPQNMEMSTYMRLAKYFKGREVGFCGLGENLMHPNFLEFMDIAIENGIKRILLTTNGTLLIEDVAKHIIGKVDAVNFSIDGVENYEKIRRGSNFELVFNNLKNLHDLREKLGAKKPKINIGFAALKSNIGDLPKLIKMAAPYIDSIGIFHFQIYDKNLMNEHLNRHPDMANKVFEESRRMARKYNILLSLRPLQPEGRGCLEPWTKPHIQYDGSVFPCCTPCQAYALGTYMEYYDDTKIKVDLSKFKVGNINDEDIMHIWNNEKFIAHRRAILKIIRSDISKKWTDEDYVKLRKEVGENGFYCRICPWRFNTAC